MASGTGNLPYPGKVYNPFDILTAEELNEDVANIEALADGSGIGDGAITSIKTSFGGNYSTSEVNTGFKWIDGKTIYKKTVSFGALPNASIKSVAHGITDLDYIVDIQAVASSPSGNKFHLPHVDIENIGYGIQVYANETDVRINTGTINRTSYTTTYVTLWYTKT